MCFIYKKNFKYELPNLLGKKKGNYPNYFEEIVELNPRLI